MMHLEHNPNNSRNQGIYIPVIRQTLMRLQKGKFSIKESDTNDDMYDVRDDQDEQYWFDELMERRERDEYDPSHDEFNDFKRDKDDDDHGYDYDGTFDEDADPADYRRGKPRNAGHKASAGSFTHGNQGRIGRNLRFEDDEETRGWRRMDLETRSKIVPTETKPPPSSNELTQAQLLAAISKLLTPLSVTPVINPPVLQPLNLSEVKESNPVKPEETTSLVPLSRTPGETTEILSDLASLNESSPPKTENSVGLSRRSRKIVNKGLSMPTSAGTLCARVTQALQDVTIEQSLKDSLIALASRH